MARYDFNIGIVVHWKQIFCMFINKVIGIQNDISIILRMARVQISDRTVWGVLCKNGLRANTLRKKPYLNQKQIQNCVNWTLVHRDWTEHNWAKVIWSDETRISILVVME